MPDFLTQILNIIRSRNPGFDLLHFDFHKRRATDALNLGELDRESTIEDLKAFQRLLRLHPSESVATALYEAGFRSAHNIAAIPEKQFVREYAGVLGSKNGGPGGQKVAQEIHCAACDVVERVRLRAMTLLSLSDRRMAASPALASSPTVINFYQDFPGYQKLFGDLNYLQCEECQSIWSPAAYFVDLMRLVSTHITKPKDKALRLSERRPDLWEIPLDCESTNQEVPYLQIVNRILEAQVKYRAEKKKHAATSVSPLFYMAVEQYPFALPFNEPLARIRELLKHFNLTLAEVYEAFLVGREANDIKASIAQAALDLSPEKYDVLTTTNTSGPSLEQAYGLVSSNVTLSDLSSIKAFLGQTGLNYERLEELLTENLRRKRVLKFVDSFDVNVGSLDNVHSGPLTGDQTIEMWLYPDYFVNVSDPLIATNGGFQVEVDTGGNVTYSWPDSDGTPQNTSISSPLAALEWEHIAFVRDLAAGETYAYLNGTPAGSSTTASAVETWTSQPVALGKNYSGGIADVRLWSTSRSAEEIKANMHRRLTGREEGLVGCWPLDDGVGTTVRDISPYKNYGMIEPVTAGTKLPAPDWPLAMDLVWDDNEIQGRTLNQFFINQALATEDFAQFLVSGEISGLWSLCVINVDGAQYAMNPLDASTKAGASTFGRLNRFIRLANTLGWSFADLDIALRSIEPPNSAKATEIDEKAIQGLAAIKKLQTRLGLQVDELCAFWSDMNTFGIGNQQAPQDLFDRTFNYPTSFRDPTGRALAPPYHPNYSPNPLYFESPLNWSMDDQLSLESQMIRARLRGSLALDDTSLGLLIDFANQELSHQDEIAGNNLGVETLTLLYRYSKLAQSLNLGMGQFLTLLRLLKKISVNSIKTVTEIVAWVDWMRKADLTVAQLEYLITVKANPWINPGYNPDAVTPLIESMFQAATPALVTPASFIRQGASSTNNSSTAGLNTSQATAIYQALQNASFIDQSGVVLHQPLIASTLLTAFRSNSGGPLTELLEQSPTNSFVPGASLRYVLTFDGQTEIDIDSNPFSSAFDAFTICAWVATSVLADGGRRLIAGNEDSGNVDEVTPTLLLQANLKFGTTDLVACVGDGSNQFEIVLPGFFTEKDSWVHVAWSLDLKATAPVWQIYRNGILAGSGTVTKLSGIYSSTSAYHIGGAGKDFWKGQIADVGIWKQALTHIEINQVMHQDNPPESISKPVAFWGIADGSGMNVADSEDQHPGTINGEAKWNQSQPLPVASILGTLLESQARQDYLVEQHLAAFFNVSTELMAATTQLTAKTRPSYLSLNKRASIKLPDSALLNPANFTFCCWVKINRLTDKESYLVDAIGRLDNSGYAVSVSEANDVVTWRVTLGGSGGMVTYTAAQPSFAEWAHLSLTFDGTGPALVINGATQTLTPSSATPLGTFSPNATAPIHIGSRGEIDHLDCAIAQVRIYNSALTSAQIETVMYQNRDRLELLDQSLVGYWPLAAGAGTRAFDATGKGNNGDVRGKAEWTSNYPASLLFDLPAGDPVPGNVESLIEAQAVNLYLAAQLHLNPVDVLGLTLRPAPFGIDGFGFGFRFDLINLRTLSLYHELTVAFNAGDQLLSYFQTAAQASDPSIAQKALAAITGWPADQIQTLEAQDFWPADSKFDTVDALGALKQCFDQANTLGSDIGLMLSLRSLNSVNLNEPAGSPPQRTQQEEWDKYQTVAHNLSQAVNSKYGASVAPQVLASILGKLEELKRDILVAFLLWELSFEFSGIKTSDDLYDFLLIDVDMSSVVQISQLKAGLNSLQLYVQSTQMNLEAETLNEIPRLWWSWMQNYRVWQANREVFLYPENYVNPALRRFKTPQFKQLETSLQQGSVTSEMADSALTSYLEGLTTVANLKIIASYRAMVKMPGTNPGEVEEIDTVFIFGRTRTEPATFYYRTLRITDKTNLDVGIWSPWQQINLTINAEEITPVYAFEKLYIFWVEQTQKTVNTNPKGQTSVEITTATIYYSFQKLDRSWVTTQTLEKDLVIGVTPFDVNSIGLLQALVQPDKRFDNAPATQPAMSVWKKVRASVIFSAGIQEQLLVLYGDYVSPTASWPSPPPAFGLNVEIDAYQQMLKEAIGVSEGFPSHNDTHVTTIVPAWVGGGNQSWHRVTPDIDPAFPNYCLGSLNRPGSQIDYFQTNNSFLGEHLLDFMRGPLVAYFPLNDNHSTIRDLISGGSSNLTGTGFSWVPGTGPLVNRIVLEFQGNNTQVPITLSEEIDQANYTIGIWLNILNPSGGQLFDILSTTNNSAPILYVGSQPAKLYYCNAEVCVQVTSPEWTSVLIQTRGSGSSPELQLNAYNLESTASTGSVGQSEADWWIWSVGSTNASASAQLANLSFWSRAVEKETIPTNPALDGFPLLEANISPLISRTNPVGNQPGWFTFDNGDEAFLVVPQGDPFQQLQNIATAKPEAASGTGSRGKLPVLTMSFGNAAYDPTNFDFSSLQLQFIRLSTSVVQKFEQKLLVGGPPMLLTLDAQYAEELPFSRFKPSTTNVLTKRLNPITKVSETVPSTRLDFNGSFGEYFWELFFYAPFLIADQFETNQRFQLAQKWYQYIFDPTPLGVANEILGYWPMDDTGDVLHDKVGTNNGSVVVPGHGYTWRQLQESPLGPNVSVFELGQSEQSYISIGNLNLANPKGPMSFVFWLYSETTSSLPWGTLFYYAPTSKVTFSVGVYFGASGQNLWFWSSASNGTWYQASTPLPPSAWVQVAVVLGSANAEQPLEAIFIDGEKSELTTATTTSELQILSAGLMNIGSFETAPSPSLSYPALEGAILGLQIWDIPLQAEAISHMSEVRTTMSGISPTSSDRFWRFRPFLNQSPESLTTELSSPQQIAAYEWDPFDPDALARLRAGAYEKGIVIRYLENLIKWGNKLFSQYSWETIVEATMLYTEALNLLGPQPKQIGEAPAPPVKTTLDFLKEYGGAANIPEFLIELELNVSNPGISIPISAKPFNLLNSYFCVPVNKRLLSMWHEVDNQLYKIRHGENIKGQPQPLPLFEPPIAPGKLVKAGGGALTGPSRASAGSPNIPYYRFSYLIQQAKDLASQVVQLGSSLLGALERQDGEQLALIQITNEAAILNLTTQIKQDQIDQLEQAGQALEASLSAAQLRVHTYNSWMSGGSGNSTSGSSGGQPGGGWTTSLLPAEKTGLDLLAGAFEAHLVSADIRVVSSALYLLPNIFGLSDGGMEFGKSMEAVAGASDAVGGVLGIMSQLAGMVGSFQRRDQEWELQAELSADDVTQIQAQIEANQTMIASAQRDLQVHQEQITQNQGIGNFYQTKFTNQQLYQWMAGRLSTIYFQSYQLAFELGQDAQMAFQYENNSARNYLNYGAWDNLEKGLTAGDSLMLSLNQLEKANIDAGVRHLEIEKTISLLQLNPQALLDLKSTGSCSFELSEQLFDYDFPGHYNRKIKTISITIPAIVGPYQNVHASLTQTASRLVTQPDIDAVEYLLPGGSKHGTAPPTIRTNWNANQQVALSSGNNDSGLFVLNFDDPRYLPFEGTGAVSSWTLDMLKAANALDFNTISDVIIRLSYTAQDGGQSFRQSVTSEAAISNFIGLRYVSLRQAFPEAWHNFMHPTSGNPTIAFPITRTMFPPNLELQTVNLGTPANTKKLAADPKKAPPVSTIAVQWLTADGDTKGLPPLYLNNQEVVKNLTQFTEPPGVIGAPVTKQVALDTLGVAKPNILEVIASPPVTVPEKVIDVVLIIPFDGKLNWPGSGT